MMNQNRLSRFYRILEETKADGSLILSPENLLYLAGFTGGEGLLVVTPDTGTLLVDSRYITQALNEVKVFKAVEFRERLKSLKELIESSKIKALAFEAKLMTYHLYDEIKKNINVSLVPLVEKFDLLRAIKDEDEISRIKEAAGIAHRAFLNTLKGISPGLMEREVAAELEYNTRILGGDNSPFDIIVNSGHRSALPHGQATKKKLSKGEGIIVDFGVKYNGYCSDETVLSVIGEPDDKLKFIHSIIKEAKLSAINGIRPGVRACEIDGLARRYIENKGYGDFFVHALGHGIGLNVHEEPRLTSKNKTLIEEGMTFTIEPGIYIPDWGGVRLEDVIVVTRDGCEVLTKLSKEIYIID